MKSAIDHAAIEQLLKNLPILKGLCQEHATCITKDFSIRTAKKGDVIFYQSDESTDLYIIIEGEAKASLVDPEGNELILATFAQGDFFGEISLFDGRPRSATITASENSTFAVLTREKFLQAIKNDPMIAIGLITSLVRRIRMTDEKLESLVFLDVSQRVIKLLLEIGKGERDEKGYYKVKKLTHRELAAHTGASREAVSKALKVLTFRKAIREEEGYFLIAPSAENLTGL
ncbi:MAG: Crp/Fnr family transcriptional regulator [Alphaproteobacteria bacterium]|uniref:Crp/Fnr family transcriptional regulator n=1 Tax=Candidatus Nitrobium versatile TaxID=2884831 RepID=A0A953J369_9BACT|nr:Crp/Fnr family transcriptional regulator [Candidatus Nitrobium versatile]